METQYRQVIATVRMGELRLVEKALRDIRVSGVSISRVKGYGEYKDFFSADWLAEYARIEVLTSAERAQEIVDAILEAASTGTPGDGIVSVIAVECVWRIRSRAQAHAEEL